MKRYLSSFIIISLVVLLISGDRPILAETEPEEIVQAGDNPEHSSQTEEPNLSTTERAFLRNSLILNELRRQLSSTERYSNNLQQKIATTKDKLEEVNGTISTLENQLGYIEMNIQTTERKMTDIIRQIAYTEQAITNSYEDLEIKEIEVAEQANLLSDYLTMIYVHKNKFYEPAGGQANVLKFLLADNSVSQNFSRQAYLQLLEDNSQQIFGRLHNLKNRLETKRQSLELQKTQLDYLKTRLENENSNLGLQKDSQTKLLEETEGRKEIFEQMMIGSIEEQLRADQEMAALQTNISYFSQALDFAQVALTPEDYGRLLQIKEDMVASQNNSEPNKTDFKFSLWPVKPNSISAYFHDERYMKAFGVDHGAIDLPAIRGSAILAPTDCLVLKVVDQDNPKIYNHLTCAGPSGITYTLGHTYQSLVKKGQFIRTGGLLGLTGGCIGERGTGLRSTGCHLHFEVWQNGQKIDPLQFLPLEDLPIEYIPANYLKGLEMKMQGEVEEYLGSRR